jgi:hypothetical protein
LDRSAGSTSRASFLLQLHLKQEQPEFSLLTGRLHDLTWHLMVKKVAGVLAPATFMFH